MKHRLSYQVCRLSHLHNFLLILWHLRQYIVSFRSIGQLTSTSMFLRRVLQQKLLLIHRRLQRDFKHTISGKLIRMVITTLVTILQHFNFIVGKHPATLKVIVVFTWRQVCRLMNFRYCILKLREKMLIKLACSVCVKYMQTLQKNFKLKLTFHVLNSFNNFWVVNTAVIFFLPCFRRQCRVHRSFKNLIVKSHHTKYQYRIVIFHKYNANTPYKYKNLTNKYENDPSEAIEIKTFRLHSLNMFRREGIHSRKVIKLYLTPSLSAP